MSGESNERAMATVLSRDAPSMMRSSFSGWRWLRKDSIVKAIVFSAFRQTITTESFI
jgi:hypothetical protein